VGKNEGIGLSETLRQLRRELADAQAKGDGERLRFEVTEDPSPGVDGHRWCHTPQLGLWSGPMSANGDVMVGEMRLRALMAEGPDVLFSELDTVLGTAWDEALEPFRDGGEGAEVSWLSRSVG